MGQKNIAIMAYLMNPVSYDFSKHVNWIFFKPNLDLNYDTLKIR